MTFPQYWSIFLKRWYLVLACLMLVGAAALVVSLLIPPVYRSTAIIQVTVHSGNNQSDINELLASNQLVQTEAQLATSTPVMQSVVIHHPDLTLTQLERMVSVSPKLNTQLFDVSVLDNDVFRAATLANEVAQTFIQQQEHRREQENKASQQQLQQEIATTRQQIVDTQRQLATLQAEGVKKERMESVTEQINTFKSHDDQWQSALAQLELSEAEENNFLLLAQPAQPMPDPVEPKLLLNTGAGLGVGLLLGFLFILLLDHMDQRVYTPEMVQQMLDRPILSSIWKVSEEERVINPADNSANVEAYRMLRSSIGFAGVDKALRYLLVTSALPREGKSTIAANLAIYMALAGKKTLLVDADLRSPTLHEEFGLEADRAGLSNAILACGLPEYPATLLGHAPRIVDANDISLDKYIHSVGIANLRVIPSGPLPPNPSELLDSKAMQRFFQALESCDAETVIFDASSLLGLSDATVLSTKVDGTIIVVDPTRAQKPQLLQARSRLSQAGSHVVGCVLNKQRCQHTSIPYSYYSRYYPTLHVQADAAQQELTESVKTGMQPNAHFARQLPSDK